MKERKCGCIVYEFGPPLLCVTHKTKADRKIQRDQRKEEKGLRKIVAQQAFDQGHDLSQFREYKSQDGKWVAHCHSCGAMCIVYDRMPERGDQVAGKAIFQPCNPDELIAALASNDAAVAHQGLDSGVATNDDATEGILHVDGL